jgi:alcohol dehydrogenase (cytochrome c)
LGGVGTARDAGTLSASLPPFLAIDAASGKTVYKFDTGGSVGSGVITYVIGDKQMVATTSGVVSGFFVGTGNAIIVIFSLP